MNLLKNLFDLADHIRGLAPDQFDMRDTDLNIPAHVQRCNPETRTLPPAAAVHTLLRGSNLGEVHNLIFPTHSGYHDLAEDDRDEEAFSASPEQAAIAVDILAMTGEVDWGRALIGDDPRGVWYRVKRLIAKVRP